MDILSVLRTLGALGVVLGLLWGALWVVRRYDIVLPGRATLRTDRRLVLVERLMLDTRRSVALVRRDGCEHLILLGPETPLVIESAIPCRTPEVPVAPAEPAAAPPPPPPSVRRDLGSALNHLQEQFQARRARAALAVPDAPDVPEHRVNRLA